MTGRTADRPVRNPDRYRTGPDRTGPGRNGRSPVPVPSMEQRMGHVKTQKRPPLKIQSKHIHTINLTQNKQFLVKLDNSRTYPIYFNRVCPLCGHTVRNPIPSEWCLFFYTKYDLRFLHQSIELNELYPLVWKNRVKSVGKGAQSAKYCENRGKMHVFS